VPEEPLQAQQAKGGQPVDWAVAALALEGQQESGDLHFARVEEQGALLGVVDGLGHGPDAALAARAAVDVAEHWRGGSLPDLFERCHDAARRTRGVVMTAASFDPRSRALTWAGIGNIDGLLVRADPGDGPGSETIMLRGGVLGHQMPALRPSQVGVGTGDVLVLATDGVDARFREEIDTRQEPRELAERLLERHRKEIDDALVLVARFTLV
jgi:negative regulator of sigma-B (phosphoserine phosphatase)